MEELTGRRLARWTIQEELRPEGRGAVYRGVDRQTGYEAVVKLLPEELAQSPDLAAQFKAVARKMMALDHPNIEHIYAADIDGGQPFIVKHPVDGMTLEQRLLRDSLPAEDIVSLGRQVASALDYAHGRAVPHGAIDASNVLLDNMGHAVVIDFGIDRLVEEALGSRADSADEGLPRPAGKEDDLRSFGLLLYIMLMGHAPSGGNGWAGAGEWRDPEGDAVDRWLRKVLAQDPAEAFSTARQTVMAFSAALETAAPTARSPRAQPAVLERQAPLGEEVPDFLPLVDDEPRWMGSRWVLFGLGGIAATIIFAGCLLTAFVLRTAFDSLLPSEERPSLPLTGEAAASISEVIGSLSTRRANGEYSPLFKGQAVPFEQGRFVRTGNGSAEYSSLGLPGGALLYLAPDTEIELAQAGDNTVWIVLNQGRALLQQPPDFPIDLGLFIASPTSATARVSGSMMGAAYDPGTGTYWVDCLQGDCWVSSGSEEVQIPSGEHVIVDASLQMVHEPGTRNELWLFAPGAVPPPTPIPYGAGFAGVDRFNALEQQRVRENDRVLWPLSGVMTFLFLGVCWYALQWPRPSPPAPPPKGEGSPAPFSLWEKGRG